MTEVVVHINYCRTCKTKVENSDKHCPNCGAAKIFFLSASEADFSKIQSQTSGAQDSTNASRKLVIESGHKSDLIKFARKVGAQAKSLSGAMTLLGILTIIGGIVIGAQSIETFNENGDFIKSYPYIQIGIYLTLAGLFQILVFRLVFDYIHLQARIREWELNKP